tara:strand:- start:10569 stop:11411 length:843 start_codon:yes stop_codon:yes gene_type:complete
MPECIYSDSKQKVYWKHEDGSKNWKTPFLEDDPYNPKTKEKSTGDLETWRKSCNLTKRKIHASMLSEDTNHLDVCCGRGGDIHKFKYSKVKTVIGIDISPSALEEAVCRSAKSGLKSRFFLLDLTKVNHPTQTIKKYKLSTISIMFAFHYFLKSKQTLLNFISYINGLNLSTGCKLYGITPDWQKIKQGMHREYCKIDFISKIPDNLNDSNCFGIAYKFWLRGLVESNDGISGVLEYLVYFPVVEKIFEDHGWKCLSLEKIDNKDGNDDGIYLYYCFHRI